MEDDGGERQAGDTTASLGALPPDILVALARRLGLASIGRLASSCRALSTALAADEVWADKVVALGGQDKGPQRQGPASSPRRAARELLTLESARWSAVQDGGPPGPSPAAREHFVAASCASGQTLVIFGGRSRLRRPSKSFNDAWALDVASGEWHAVPDSTSSPRPAPRFFNAETGGQVIKDGGQQEWLCVVGGKRMQGYRDNETWLLGPLGRASTAASWVWREVQADGRPQSRVRPKARFHHTLTTVDMSARPPSDPCHGTHLVILGGHDYTISPLASMWILSLNHVVLGRTAHDDQVAAPFPPPNPASRDPAAGRVGGGGAGAGSVVGELVRWCRAPPRLRVNGQGFVGQQIPYVCVCVCVCV